MTIAKPFLDAEVILRLSGIPLEARSPMIGNVSGRHRSSVRGSSLEFAQYRKYVPGDDTRRMDWRVWGRSDRCFIKEFEADTNLRMCIVLDTSGSMNYGPNGAASAPLPKMEYARKLAGTLAWLTIKQGDAVGLYCAGNELNQSIPPRRGARHLKVIIDRLERVQADGQTGLASTLHHVSERIPRRSLIVVISDLYVEPATFASSFQHLRYRKHDVALFHVLDQSELDLDFSQPMKFIDLEGGDAILADPILIGNAYRDGVKQYFEDVDEIVRLARVDYRRAMLQDEYGNVLARFLSARQRRKGSTRNGRSS
ncbi:MAG: DUF58 domain-containing protein [Pirellula sp.]